MHTRLRKKHIVIFTMCTLLAAALALVVLPVAHRRADTAKDKHLVSEYGIVFSDLRETPPFNTMTDDSSLSLKCIYHDAAGKPAPKRCGIDTSEQVLQFNFKDEADFNNKAQALEEKLIRKGWAYGEGYMHKAFRSPVSNDWSYIMLYTKQDCGVRLTAAQDRPNQLTTSYSCGY